MHFLRVVLVLVVVTNAVVGAGSKKDVPMIDAKKPQAEQSMQPLVTLLNGFTAYQADFEQETQSAEGKVLQKVKGVVKLQKPGHFYWQAFQPYPQLLVSNGVTIWQYDEDLEQVVIKAYKEQAQQVYLVQLLENPEKLMQLYAIKSSARLQGKHTQTFELMANDKSTSIKSLGFTFDQKQLAALYFVDALNQKTTIQFSHRRINPKIPAKAFIFVVPKGADVVGSAQTFPAK